MSSIASIFHNQFNQVPTHIVASPGRINLLGEHIDYNHGFVLPAAIDKTIEVAIALREDEMINMYAVDINETASISIDAIKPSIIHWVNYIIGVCKEVRFKIDKGFNICIHGDIPSGAGLSSSAAVECAVLFAINELYHIGLDKKQMALMAQKAEHAFAGVQCGIMDMYASLFGKKDHVMLLDCDTMEHKYYPIVLKEHAIVLFNTNIKHQLASSEYNNRRKECEGAFGLIQKKFPQVQSFRDITEKMVKEVLSKDNTANGSKWFHRALYVVQEIQRVQAAVKDLIENDIESFGNKMFATHEGLSKLYEVSCPELDFLVHHVKNNDAVIGARMMGGGFGGCTINIIRKDQVFPILSSLQTKYQKQFGKELTHYIVSIENGTSLIL